MWPRHATAGLVATVLFVTPALAGTQKLTTSAGDVELSRDENKKTCAVTWNGKAISSWACEWEWDPGLIGQVKTPSGGFDEILVVQHSPMGNACNGGDLLVLGVDRAKLVTLIGTLERCGGPTPQLSSTPQRFTLTIPAAPPNRGTGIVPGEIWIVEGRSLRKTK